jgi:hypothetical protein
LTGFMVFLKRSMLSSSNLAQAVSVSEKSSIDSPIMWHGGGENCGAGLKVTNYVSSLHFETATDVVQVYTMYTWPLWKFKPFLSNILLPNGLLRQI